MITGNNLIFLQLARLLASEAFHCLLTVLSSSENLGISVRHTRDEDAGTYYYNTMKMMKKQGKAYCGYFFYVRQESLCTADHLRLAIKTNNEGSPNMLFMERMDICESLLRKLTATTQQTVNGKSALRVVTVATKPRKMKILHFQKGQHGTAPTVIGQHTERAEIDIPVLLTRIFDNENANIDNLADENGSEGLRSNESDKHTDEFLFKTGKVAVLRGTDGLSFNLLRVSKDYKYNITPRTRIQGDFLIEHDRLDNGSIEFREDTQWKLILHSY